MRSLGPRRSSIDPDEAVDAVIAGDALEPAFQFEMADVGQTFAHGEGDAVGVELALEQMGDEIGGGGRRFAVVEHGLKPVLVMADYLVTWFVKTWADRQNRAIGWLQEKCSYIWVGDVVRFRRNWSLSGDVE